jgi:hypothetical protein
MANDAEVSQYVNERTANRRYEDWEPAAEWAQDEDRPTYAWTVEGKVESGTLVEYAEAHRQAHYAGLDVSRHLWDGTDLVLPHISQAEWSEDDYATVTISVDIGETQPGEQLDVAQYRIDGRA